MSAKGDDRRVDGVARSGQIQNIWEIEPKEFRDQLNLDLGSEGERGICELVTEWRVTSFTDPEETQRRSQFVRKDDFSFIHIECSV